MGTWLRVPWARRARDESRTRRGEGSAGLRLDRLRRRQGERQGLGLAARHQGPPSHALGARRGGALGREKEGRAHLGGIYDEDVSIGSTDGGALDALDLEAGTDRAPGPRAVVLVTTDHASGLAARLRPGRGWGRGEGRERAARRRFWAAVRL